MGKSVLVVDDAAFMRMMIKDILEKNGFQVVGEAENGAIAVEKYKELSPDLVTMDITMPEKDGITALKEIKQFDSDAIVIMCSAMGQQARSEERRVGKESRYRRKLDDTKREKTKKITTMT